MTKQEYDRIADDLVLSIAQYQERIAYVKKLKGAYNAKRLASLADSVYDMQYQLWKLNISYYKGGSKAYVKKPDGKRRL